MNNLNEQVEAIIKSCMNDDIDIPMSAASLAKCALDIMDPENISPALVSYACNRELRQIARQLLRREFDPSTKESTDQVEMFDKLQDRYPAHRNGELLYVPRMQLTYEERMFNVERMQREIESKQKHADALMAETQSMLEAGFFEIMDNG